MKQTSEQNQKKELIMVLIELAIVAVCYMIVAHLDYLQMID